jgi:hypothetical protein
MEKAIARHNAPLSLRRKEEKKMLLRAITRRVLRQRPASAVRLFGTKNDGQDNNALESPWTRVYDERQRGYYWWNKSSNQTTAVGVPRPTSYHLDDVREEYYEERRVGVGAQMGSAFVMGAGVSVGFAVVGVAARMVFGG